MDSAFYLLMPRTGFGVARPAPEIEDDAVYALSDGLMSSGYLPDAPALVWTRDRGTPSPDWVWGLRSIPLLSPRFREIIEQYRSPGDDVQWIQGTLLNLDGSSEERWTPHFPGERDILDIEETEWGPSGLPIRWVLSPRKMEHVTVTTRPAHSGNMIVNAEIMRALRRAKLTGYAVMRARVADA